MIEPKLPKEISPFARACLDSLAHYHEYHPTHDVAAWWRQSATRENRDAIVAMLGKTLGSFGAVRTRVWGDVVSVELELGGKTVFSFQIAERSAQLEEPVEGVWPGGL